MMFEWMNKLRINKPCYVNDNSRIRWWVLLTVNFFQFALCLKLLLGERLTMCMCNEYCLSRLFLFCYLFILQLIPLSTYSSFILNSSSRSSLPLSAIASTVNFRIILSLYNSFCETLMGWNWISGSFEEINLWTYSVFISLILSTMFWRF